MTEPHERYRMFLENLDRASLDRLPELVTADVHFKDPFNDLRGADKMAVAFHHMFDKVENVRFKTGHVACADKVCLMDWRFEGSLSGKPWAFDGASVIHFAADGRVSAHIDYWDAASNFYERLPVIGWLLAKIRRTLAVR